MRLSFLLKGLPVVALALSLSTNAFAQGEPDAPPAPPKKEEQTPPPPPPPPPPGDGDRPERPNGERGRRGGRGRRGAGGAGGGMADLNLTEEQQAKMAKAREEMVKKFREARESGDREAIMGLREEYQKQLREILTPEQLKKLEEGRGGMGRRGRGGRGGEGRGGEGRGGRGGRGGFGGRGRGGAQSPDRMVEEAKKALVLGETEEAKITPLLKAAVEKRMSARQTEAAKRRELLGFIKQGGTTEEIAAKVAAFRKARDDAEKAAEDAGKALAESLDAEQRAKLVALGIIR